MKLPQMTGLLIAAAAMLTAWRGDELVGDLFIDHDPTGRFSLIDLVGIKQFLEENLSVAVDVTTRSSLHPMLRDDIEQSAVRVF